MKEVLLVKIQRIGGLIKIIKVPLEVPGQVKLDEYCGHVSFGLLHLFRVLLSFLGLVLIFQFFLVSITCKN